MKKSNSESDLIPFDHTPHSRAFVRKLNSPDYQELRTAEILADNEIDTLMDEIAETRPYKIVKEENNFIKKANKTRPAPVDRDFHELAKRVKRGGKKTRKRRKGTRRRKLKKKKSTRKKKRGGVGPSVPPVSRVNQTRRTRVRQGPALLQGLNQLRDMDHGYIGVAMERLSTPDLVLALDQEGTLDDVMERVTERITFFINRNQENIEQLRDFLDETTEAQQTLDRADGNLGDRYRNFIEQLRRLTN